eukprot:752779-Hanusia_phi.AAC.1
MEMTRHGSISQVRAGKPLLFMLNLPPHQRQDFAPSVCSSDLQPALLHHGWRPKYEKKKKRLRNTECGPAIVRAESDSPRACHPGGTVRDRGEAPDLPVRSGPSGAGSDYRTVPGGVIGGNAGWRISMGSPPGTKESRPGTRPGERAACRLTVLKPGSFKLLWD